MTNSVTAPWGDVFDELPEDEKAKISEYCKESSAKFQALYKFRDLKIVLRNHLESSTNLSPEAIREIEQHTDYLLATFRKIVEDEGGTFKILLDMPSLVPYNLFDLRDEYKDCEGTPLGPFYEEEDINEANRLAEEREIEKQESGFDESMKVAA